MNKRIVILCILLLQLACSKSFLTTNASTDDKKDVNLTQLAGLLNYSDLFGETPVMGEQSADDYFLNPDYYAQLSEVDTNIYTWQKGIYNGHINIPDWDIPYKQVNTCNVVLEGLLNIIPNVATRQQWNEIKGSALFMRSFAFFNASQVFAGAYDQNNADQEPGIPMPLTADMESAPARSTMKQTYDQVINDLLAAVPLLPAQIQAGSRNLPNKPAAFALLARVYLSMSDYSMARAYADSCLLYHKALIDFNKLQLSARYPIGELNEETLYQSWLSSSGNVIRGKQIPDCVIDSNLYNSYDSSDIRKHVFFTISRKNQPYFNCSYSGKVFAFSGLATDEVYLIRAECNARLGAIQNAMADVNKLLKNRYKTDSFPGYQTNSMDTAIDIILKERRKELIFRGLRWSDLKRLNKKEADKITLYRAARGNSYRLLPNSNRYVLPIPDDAIKGSHIAQNNRD